MLWFNEALPWQQARLPCAAAAPRRALPAAQVRVSEHLWCPALSHLVTGTWKSCFIFPLGLSDGVGWEEPWRTLEWLSVPRSLGVRKPPLASSFIGVPCQIWWQRDDGGRRAAGSRLEILIYWSDLLLTRCSARSQPESSSRRRLYLCLLCLSAWETAELLQRWGWRVKPSAPGEAEPSTAQADVLEATAALGSIIGAAPACRSGNGPVNRAGRGVGSAFHSGALSLLFTTVGAAPSWNQSVQKKNWWDIYSSST